MTGIMTAYVQKLINPRLHKIIYTIRTCNIVRLWLFLTTLLLWDYKFELKFILKTEFAAFAYITFWSQRGKRKI